MEFSLIFVASNHIQHFSCVCLCVIIKFLFLIRQAFILVDAHRFYPFELHECFEFLYCFLVNFHKIIPINLKKNNIYI